jgi:hypothetical protein
LYYRQPLTIIQLHISNTNTTRTVVETAVGTDVGVAGVQVLAIVGIVAVTWVRVAEIAGYGRLLVAWHWKVVRKTPRAGEVDILDDRLVIRLSVSTYLTTNLVRVGVASDEHGSLWFCGGSALSLGTAN